MTPASICASGAVRLGGCVSHADLCIYPGFVFEGNIQRTDEITGLPANWPAGMTARLRVITDGTGSPVLLFPSAPVTDEWIRFTIAGTDTAKIPRAAEIYLDLNFGDGNGWRPWLLGRKTQTCR